MKQLWKISVCLSAVLILVGFAQAQTTKTAKGYFCGFSEGDAGYLTMRVGRSEKTFAWYGDEPAIKFVGFKNEEQKDLWNLPVGTEIVVNYVFKRPKVGGGATNIIRKLTLTGKRNKNTSSCFED